MRKSSMTTNMFLSIYNIITITITYLECSTGSSPYIHISIEQSSTNQEESEFFDGSFKCFFGITSANTPTNVTSGIPHISLSSVFNAGVIKNQSSLDYFNNVRDHRRSNTTSVGELSKEKTYSIPERSILSLVQLFNYVGYQIFCSEAR